MPSGRGNLGSIRSDYRALESSSQSHGVTDGFLLSPAGEGKALEGRVAQKPWLIFRDHLHKAQEWSIPMSMKLDKNARRPVWRNQDLLTIIKYEEEAYREWKPARVTYMECRDFV